jgi:hypothetical protein
VKERARTDWSPTPEEKVREVTEGLGEVYVALAGVSELLAKLHHGSLPPDERLKKIDALYRAWGAFLDLAGQTINVTLAGLDGIGAAGSWKTLVEHWRGAHSFSGDGRGALGPAIDEQRQWKAKWRAESEAREAALVSMIAEPTEAR